MPWLDDVQQRILEQISSPQLDPLDQLKEALLWRGFLARRKGNRVELLRRIDDGHAGNGDRATLSREQFHGGLIVTHRDLEPQQENQILRRWSALSEASRPLVVTDEIYWQVQTPAEQQQTLMTILGLPGPQGMTGRGSHHVFGNLFPAEQLDLGIALLVRAIQYLDIRTSLSGHGSPDDCRLRVEFLNNLEGRKFKNEWEENYRLEMGDRELFVFRDGTDGHYSLVIGGKTNDPEVAFHAISAAQKLARLILNNPLATAHPK